MRTAEFHIQLTFIKLSKGPQPENTERTVVLVARRLQVYEESSGAEAEEFLPSAASDESESSLYSNMRFLWFSHG
jgi:hypothetical protein